MRRGVGDEVGGWRFGGLVTGWRLVMGWGVVTGGVGDEVGGGDWGDWWWGRWSSAGEV